MTSSEVDHLAAFTASLTLSDLPPAVVERAQLVTADTVGCIIGGVDTPDVARLAAGLSKSYPGPGTVLGRSDGVMPAYAGMVNGVGGTVLELDEGHKRAAGHPAIHIIPALFATAEQPNTSITGEAFITGLVAGYEVSVRIGEASQPLADGYHPHGLWGVVGAVAGVARALGLDGETTREAIAMAPNHAQHTHFDAATEGRTVRNTYAGMVVPAALAVVEQAQAGFTGLDDGINLHLDRTSENGLRPIETDSLGEQWMIEEGYFKFHAACRYTHPAIDAVDQLEREGLDTSAGIDRIIVETYPAAASLDDSRPTNPLAARFSLPFAVATRIHHGHARKSAFEEDALIEEVYDIAGTVTVEANDEFTQAVPDSRGARVIIVSEDGTRREATIPHARGGAERPLTKFELREKFDDLVIPVLDKQGTEKLWKTSRELPEADPGELLRLTVQG